MERRHLEIAVAKVTPREGCFKEVHAKIVSCGSCQTFFKLIVLASQGNGSKGRTGQRVRLKMRDHLIHLCLCLGSVLHMPLYVYHVSQLGL